MESTVTISFVVPAYNEELYVRRTVEAIHRSVEALGRAHEVIVADDSSSDGTASIAAAAGARVISVNHRQIAATRNSGAHSASGDLLVFVDADTEVNAAVVAAVVAAVDRGAVGGGCHFRFDGRIPFYGRCLEVFADVVYPIVRLASGCFLFCTREAFDAVGGFDEARFAGEEAAMSIALRRHGKFVIVPQTVTTSGRKLRAYRGRELAAMAADLARTRNAGRRRAGLDVWYGERRPDPEAPERGT